MFSSSFLLLIVIGWSDHERRCDYIREEEEYKSRIPTLCILSIYLIARNLVARLWLHS
jgi:hypothetical protein